MTPELKAKIEKTARRCHAHTHLAKMIADITEELGPLLDYADGILMEHFDHIRKEWAALKGK